MVGRVQEEHLRDRIKELIAPLAGAEGPVMPMLHAIQGEFGYVPEQAVLVIAQSLNLTRAEVHGIVSFYHDFRRSPAGRTVLKLCRAEACQAMGAERLADHVAERLGVTWHGSTPDGAITLEPIFCLGLCAAGPAGQVGHEGVARLTEAKLDVILDSLR